MEQGTERACDIWMWDGSAEYEGAVVKLADDGFTVHLRETRRAGSRSATGRRFNTTFFDLQRQFVGRRFLAYCKLQPEQELTEVEINSVQRSSAADYDYFVGGRFRPLDESQKETLKRMSVRGPGALIAGRSGPLSPG